MALAATATIAAQPMPMEQLEKSFWACDYAATIAGIYATPISYCSGVTDELKLRKFGGDFGELLTWWRLKKPIEHARLSVGHNFRE
jgi:hypothetical protein